MEDAPDRILRLKPVLARTELSRATLYRKLATGAFRERIQLSTRCVGWRESDIAAWMRNPMFYTVSD